MQAWDELATDRRRRPSRHFAASGEPPCWKIALREAFMVAQAIREKSDD
jgi:hypothetical protein